VTDDGLETSVEVSKRAHTYQERLRPSSHALQSTTIAYFALVNDLLAPIVEWRYWFEERMTVSRGSRKGTNGFC